MAGKLTSTVPFSGTDNSSSSSNSGAGPAAAGVVEVPKKVERRGRPKGSKNKPKVGPDGQIIPPASASSTATAAATKGKKRTAAEASLEQGAVKVERRGRPKGSKNRPKEVKEVPVEVSKPPARTKRTKK